MGSSGVGSLEELTMLAVQSLAENAYGITIHEALKEAGRNISIGSLYVTLGRLEEKGYVTSTMGDPTAERGGRAKKYFALTGAGVQALVEAAQARASMRNTQFGYPGRLAWM